MKTIRPFAGNVQAEVYFTIGKKNHKWKLLKLYEMVDTNDEAEKG